MRLLKGGIHPQLVRDCELKLVEEEGFAAEVDFAELLTSKVDTVYLDSIGIVAKGAQIQIIKLHKALREQYLPPLPPIPPISLQSGIEGNHTLYAFCDFKCFDNKFILKQLRRHFPVEPW